MSFLEPPTALYAACFGLALSVSLILTPLVARWASEHGMVAKPRQDRWHNKPTPLMGGIAIYAATTLAILAFTPLDMRVFGILVGGAILFLTGVVDDRVHLRPHTKLILQIVAACVLILSGVKIETTQLAIVAIPLTVLWVVGLTNAFNLLDNMDGLSAGTAVIASLFLFAFSTSVGNVQTAVLCLALAGGAGGFLVYNFNPARIFMGDSGSMFLGFTMSAIALLGTREMASDIFFVLLVPAAMMGLPIFDTTLVTIVRTLEGRPLSQGGRDHLSHRLVALGLSERSAVLVLYALAATFGFVGLTARSIGFWGSLAIALGLLALVAILGAYLGQVRIYSPARFAEAERASILRDRPVINGMISFKREISLAGLDFVLVSAAYLGAYLLRFGTQADPAPEADPSTGWAFLFSNSIAVVLLVKLSVLLAAQVYRGMMRYVGVADLMSFVRASVMGTGILFLLSLVQNRLPIPKSVLVIDLLLFTVLLVGSRLSFAALTDTFARMQSQRLPHVLIVGASDLGELVLRSILRARPPRYQPVGFLDPDPGKRNRAIHGLLVHGTPGDLQRVANERDVDLVVLALPGASPVAEQLRGAAAAIELPVYDAPMFVEMHFAEGGLPEPTPAAATTTPTAPRV